MHRLAHEVRDFVPVYRFSNGLTEGDLVAHYGTSQRCIHRVHTGSATALEIFDGGNVPAFPSIESAPNIRRPNQEIVHERSAAVPGAKSTVAETASEPGGEQWT